MKNRLNKKRKFIKEHLKVTNFNDWVDGTDYGLAFKSNDSFETFNCCSHFDNPFFSHFSIIGTRLEGRAEGIQIKYFLDKKIYDKFHKLW